MLPCKIYTENSYLEYKNITFYPNLNNVISLYVELVNFCNNKHADLAMHKSKYYFAK